MKRIENIGFGDLKLVQDTENFRYGIDAVILADFTWKLRRSFRTAVDLGSGTGVIPFILSHKNNTAEFIGIELQSDSVRMAEESCRLNCLEDRVRFVNMDIADITKDSLTGVDADVVTCNPPYFAKGGGLPASDPGRFIARHETSAVLDDFIRAAAVLLGGKGDFFLVHRPSRLVDIFCSCRKHGLEPKNMRYVVPKQGEIPNIVLIHCTAGGGRELSLMKPLCVYDDKGRYTDEIEKIYERK